MQFVSNYSRASEKMGSKNNCRINYRAAVVLDLHFSVNDTKIDRVTETLFLGVINDECLTCKPHILNLTSKISKFLGIIYKSSFCLMINKSSLCTLYYSLVYPYLYYCACVWSLTLISSAWLPYRNVLLERFLEVLSMLTLIQSLKV